MIVFRGEEFTKEIGLSVGEIKENKNLLHLLVQCPYTS